MKVCVCVRECVYVCATSVRTCECVPEWASRV